MIHKPLFPRTWLGLTAPLLLPVVLVLAVLAILAAPSAAPTIIAGSPHPSHLAAAQTAAPDLPTIVLADGPSGLEIVSSPAAVPLTIGHVAYLPVEVQDYHRPITISAQTLIHTYVDDLTPSEPGISPPFAVGTLDAPQDTLELQTLRLRTHALTLTFTVEGDVVSATPSTTLRINLTLEPAIQPRTPLFGIHSSPFYDGLPEPFILVYGPDCGSCPTTPGDPPGSTRDRDCAKQLGDSCDCHYFQWIFDAPSDALIRQQAPEMQRYASQFLRSVGGWPQIQIEPGQYLTDTLDWVFNDLSPQERDYSPLFTGVMYGSLGWMTCPTYTNPDGSVGFFDVNNIYLLNQYRAYVRELTSRYAPELRFVELGNEPANEFYLCPCLPYSEEECPCNADSGPNQPACREGPDSPEFVAAYGDLLYTTADIAADEMAAANPEALLTTGALEMVPIWITDLSETTEYMITRGLLTDHDNVAIGIHQYPYHYPPLWIKDASGDPLNCSYYQEGHDIFWLPEGCETAPPLEGTFEITRGSISARDLWEDLDVRVDLTDILSDAQNLGVLDQFYLFDTELHAGFHDIYAGEPSTATTPAREALAGLRIGAINAHQRVLGTEFVFAPSDPMAYNLLVKHLAGATPVYDWDAPLMDADYSGLVYKLFTRGDEDIIALWSNYSTTLALNLLPVSGSVDFRQVTLTRFDAGAGQFVSVESPSTPSASIAVKPLKQFYFLSVISDRPGFGWLSDVSVSRLIYLPLLMRNFSGVRN